MVATLDDVLGAIKGMNALMALTLKDGGKADGWPYRRPTGYDNDAAFLQPTDENTLTWGDRFAYQITAADVANAPAATGQLVHVKRTRPTTFTLLLNVEWGIGWSTEPAILVAVEVQTGVGQAQGKFRKTYTVAAPLQGTVLQDVFQLPAQALQAQATITGLIQPGVHSALVTILAAPVYA